MSSVITLRRVLPEFYKYGTGTLIWRVLYYDDSIIIAVSMHIREKEGYKLCVLTKMTIAVA